mmetsp:Transcript_1147/g.1935  ORF Transcript_1147/g.1935 Transcript_1147/m.1935 type:complete len:237 (+) Transcript_1147:2790-3500(+)
MLRLSLRVLSLLFPRRVNSRKSSSRKSSLTRITRATGTWISSQPPRTSARVTTLSLKQASTRLRRLQDLSSPPLLQPQRLSLVLYALSCTRSWEERTRSRVTRTVSQIWRCPSLHFQSLLRSKKTIAGSLHWSIWDKIEIDGSEKPLTLADFLRFFQEKYNVEVNMVSYAVSILHSFFSNAEKRAERMKMTMPELAESVTKKSIDPNQKYLQFEIICVDENDNDVDFPPVSYKLRK